MRVSLCGADGCVGSRRCRACKNAYMRAWRAEGRERPPTKDAAHARGLTSMRIHRGILKRGACVVCKAPNAEAHHPDYSKPDDIIWLCRPHHRAFHKAIGD